MNKYNAKKITIDGITFHSKKEGRRYQELKLLKRAGVISGLELQPRFDININGKYCGHYKADFRYHENGKTIIEDCKGMKTPMYNFKKKIVQAMYDIEILET